MKSLITICARLLGACLVAIVFFGGYIFAGVRPSKQILICHGQRFQLRDFISGTKTAISPNGTLKIRLTNDLSFHVLHNQVEIGVFRHKDLDGNVEILWSPNSQVFGITYSDGGAIGGYHAYLYRVVAGHVQEIDSAINAAYDQFKSIHFCKARGENVWVAGWTPDSKEVLVICEVYPTGDCGSEAGFTEGYLVTLDGHVTDRYSGKQVGAVRNSCEVLGRSALP